MRIEISNQRIMLAPELILCPAAFEISDSWLLGRIQRELDENDKFIERLKKYRSRSTKSSVESYAPSTDGVVEGRVKRGEGILSLLQAVQSGENLEENLKANEPLLTVMVFEALDHEELLSFNCSCCSTEYQPAAINCREERMDFGVVITLYSVLVCPQNHIIAVREGMTLEELY